MASARTVIFPDTDVSYFIQTGVTNSSYQWASADGTAGGVAPAVSFGGYFSCNAGSELSNFINLVGDNPDKPSTITYNVSVRFTTPTAGVTGILSLPVDVTTPSISNSTIFGNRIRMNILGTSGSDTVFSGEGTFIHSDALSSHSSNPAYYQFIIDSGGSALNGAIEFDITLSGIYGTNTSNVDLGIWAGLA